MSANRIIAICVALAVVACAGLAAWAAKNSKYIGSAQCLACHKDMHEALTNGYNKTAHRAAMADATKKPNAIVAKFDDNSPIKKSDIKYVLGTGKVYQNYLDKDLKVLPGEWNTKDQKWVSIESVDGATQCVGCHATNFNPNTKTWTELGVGCERCHGPGSEHAESMEASDINGLKTLDSKHKDMVCGQCHSVGNDPTGKYAFPTTFSPGEDIDKHFKLKDVGEHARNSQYNTFIASKHYQGGMYCTTCHDPHGDKTKAKPQLKRAVNDQCMACHASTIESLKSHAPTAAADATCATCHMPSGSHKFAKATN